MLAICGQHHNAAVPRLLLTHKLNTMAEEAQLKKRKPNWTQEETLHLVSRIQERELVINGTYKQG